MEQSPPIIYRPNVGAIIQRQDGYILIAERSDVPGAWQFPQGGIQPGETPLQALERELIEEVGLHPENYRVGASREGYKYRFPAGKTKDGCQGQEQIYYLVHLHGSEDCISIETEEPEFSCIRWILPHEFDLSWLLPAKRAVYTSLLGDFFDIKSKETQHIE